MKQGILGLGLALFSACAPLAGCEALGHSHRSNSEDAAREEGDEAKVGAVKSEPTKGFFKSSRLPGAMSDEGREIEKNLGIR